LISFFYPHLTHCNPVIVVVVILVFVLLFSGRRVDDHTPRRTWSQIQSWYFVRDSPRSHFLASRTSACCPGITALSSLFSLSLHPSTHYV